MPAGNSSSRGLGRHADGPQRPPQPRFLTLPRVDPPRDLENFAHERLLFAADMDKVEGGGRGSHTRHLGTARRVVLVVDCFLVVCSEDGVVAGVMPVEEMSPDVTVQSVVLDDSGGRRRRTQHQLMLESSRQGCFLLQQTDGTNAIERLLYVVERIHEEVFDRRLRVTEAPPDVDLARGVYIKPPAVVRRLFTSAWQPYVVLVADEDAEDDVDTTTDDSRGPPAGGRPRTQQNAEWGGGGGGGGRDAYPTRSSARGSQAGLGARPGSLMKSPRSRAGSVHETRQPFSARPQQQQQQSQPPPQTQPQPRQQPQPPHTETFDRDRDREEFTRLGGGLGNADLADDEEEIIEIVRKVRRRPGSPARAHHYPSRLSTAAPATTATSSPSAAAAAAASAPTRRNPLADDDGSNGSEEAALLFDERGKGDSPLAALREGWVKDEFWRSYNDALERRAPLPTRRRGDAPSGTTGRAAPAHTQTRTRPPRDTRAVYEGRQWWAGEPSTDADSSAAASTVSQRSSPGVATTHREYRSGGGGSGGPRSVHARKRACLDTAELVMDKVEKLSVDIEQARRRLDSTSSRYPSRHNSSAKPSRGGGGGATVVQPRTDEPTPWGAYVADWNPTSQWAWDGGLDQRK